MSYIKGKNLITTDPFVTCPYCGEDSKEWRCLHWKHLKLSHDKKLADVRLEFPDHPTMTKSFDDDRLKGAKKNKENKDGKKKVNCICGDIKDILVGKFEADYKWLPCCEAKGISNPDGRTKPEAQNNRVKTFQKKYVVDNPQQVDEFVKKASKTCDDNHGGRGFGSKKLAIKTRKVIKEKYGTDNIMQSPEGYALFIKGLQKRYGNDITNVQHVFEVRQRTTQTILNHYKEHGHHLKGTTYLELHGDDATEKLLEIRRKNGAKGFKKSQEMGYGPSKPQLEIFKLVNKIIPKAKLEFGQNILYNDERYYYFLDIAIHELKINIEYDCAWTHPDPEKDKFRDKVLKSVGWKTIRYFERIPSLEELENDINSML